MSYHHYIGAPAAQYTESFRRETEKGLSTIGPSSIHNALEVDLPSGTVLWGSGVSSAAKGMFQANVVAGGYSGLEFGIQLDGSEIGVPTLEVRIFDQDQSFKREVAKYGRTIRGSAMRFYRVSPNVPDPDAHLKAVLQLDEWLEPEPLHFVCRFRPNDLPIRAEGGVGLGIAILQADFPAAHKDALGQFIGPVYGRHDSNGAGNAGFIPTYCVDTVNHVYAWSLGAGQSVTNLYVDGELANTADWTASYTTVNGKLFSIVTLTDAADDAVVTLDAYGLTDEPDGSGTLITNRVEILKHIAANFLWNAWTSGDYFPDSDAPLGLASLAALAQLLDDIGDEGSFLIGGSEQLKGDVFMRGFLESFGNTVKAWWNNAGQLDFGIIDHRPVTYSAEQVYWEEDVRGGVPSIQWPVTNITREVVTGYVFDEAGGQYRQTLSVSDLSVREKVSVQRTNPWGARWIV